MSKKYFESCAIVHSWLAIKNELSNINLILVSFIIYTHVVISDYRFFLSPIQLWRGKPFSHSNTEKTKPPAISSQ